MRLSHQLFVGSALVFLTVLAAVYGSYVETSYTHLERQLAVQSQDTATSLALTLNGSLRDGGLVQTARSIDQIFASGVYRRIALLDLHGNPIVEKVAEGSVDGMPPSWLRRLFPFKAPMGKAVVGFGAHRMALVELECSPESAYRQLEDFSEHAAFWLGFAYLITLLLLRLLLKRVLDPLRDIETATAEIAQRRFTQIHPLPATYELRRVVEGLNRLSSTVEHLLDEEERRAHRFHLLAHHDPLVGLPNRAGLAAKLDELAGEMRNDVALAMIEISGLAAYNGVRGHPDGDEMLVSLGEVINAEAARVRDGECFSAHLQAGCFAVIVTSCDEAGARRFGDAMRHRLAAEIRLQAAICELDFAIGICSCLPGAASSEILASADTALAAAHHLSQGAVVIDWLNTLPDVASQAWRRRVQRALDERRFFLVGQGVFRLPQATELPELLHREVFARMTLGDGDELSAGQFMPMAARHGFLEAIDRTCLDILFAHVMDGAEQGCYAFNLSAEALRRPVFTRWLLDRLHAIGVAARWLCVEVTDHAAQQLGDEFSAFVTELRQLGVRLTIDQFGLSAGGFQLLRKFLPDYVKLAGSLLEGVVDSNEKHFFLESVCTIASSLNIPVIATCVEDDEHLPILRALGVYGVQGNALAPVADLA